MSCTFKQSFRKDSSLAGSFARSWSVWSIILRKLVHLLDPFLDFVRGARTLSSFTKVPDATNRQIQVGGERSVKVRNLTFLIKSWVFISGSHDRHYTCSFRYCSYSYYSLGSNGSVSIRWFRCSERSPGWKPAYRF